MAKSIFEKASTFLVREYKSDPTSHTLKNILIKYGLHFARYHPKGSTESKIEYRMRVRNELNLFYEKIIPEESERIEMTRRLTRIIGHNPLAKIVIGEILARLDGAEYDPIPNKHARLKGIKKSSKLRFPAILEKACINFGNGNCYRRRNVPNDGDR